MADNSYAYQRGAFYFIERRDIMPYKPQRPCSYPGCARLTPLRYCREHQWEVNARYNKFERDPAERQRYGKEWRQIRQQYLREHVLCEDCEKAGRLTPATEVHHKQALSAGGTHARGNLRALCKRCHSSITAREGGRWG